jgi:hypothetical protein
MSLTQGSGAVFSLLSGYLYYFSPIFAKCGNKICCKRSHYFRDLKVWKPAKEDAYIYC